MNQATIEFIKQWLLKANEDIFVVEKLTEKEIIAPSSACFHCQQAVERFLKAFLIANNIGIIKTHNIEFLLSECSDIDPDFAEIDPKELSDFGVDTRYPGDIYIPDEKETLFYKNITLDIKNLVENKINEILNSQ